MSEPTSLVLHILGMGLRVFSALELALLAFTAMPLTVVGREQAMIFVSRFEGQATRLHCPRNEPGFDSHGLVQGTLDLPNSVLPVQALTCLRQNPETLLMRCSPCISERHGR